MASYLLCLWETDMNGNPVVGELNPKRVKIHFVVRPWSAQILLILTLEVTRRYNQQRAT